MDAVGLFFRKHPELEPTGKLSILGTAVCSAARLNAYVKRRNPRAPEIAELYLQSGRRYGVRGDVAYCQMVYETRCWSNEFSGPDWGPFSLAERAEEASVAVHMQLLYMMAADMPVPSELDTADRRAGILERSGLRGSVRCWEDLNGKWAIGGKRYGQDIVSMWRAVTEWSDKGEVTVADENEKMQAPSGLVALREGLTRRVDWSSLCSEEMNWLKEWQLLPDPVPHPDRKVTWSELASLFFRWERRTSAITMEENKGSIQKEG